MRQFKVTAIIIFIGVICLSSCSIQKRVYRKGYTVNLKRSSKLEPIIEEEAKAKAVYKEPNYISEEKSESTLLMQEQKPISFIETIKARLSIVKKHEVDYNYDELIKSSYEIKPTNSEIESFGVSGLVFTAIGALLLWFVHPLLGVVFGLFGVIFSIVGLVKYSKEKDYKKRSGLPIASMILSLSLLLVSWFKIFMDNFSIGPIF